MSFKLTATGIAALLDEFPDTPPPAALRQAQRILKGTDQQERFWGELVAGETHVLAEARAGCGKSSSCREAMHRMLRRKPSLRVRYSVFNRANADEFRADCPPSVDVGTSHSFGYAALKQAFRSQIEKNKTYLILDETREGRQLPRYIRKSISMLVGQAKNHGYTADWSPQQLTELVIHFDINAYGRTGMLVMWAEDVLKRSAEWTELVDFDDMLWLPGLHGVAFPPCDVLFLDEVQDFNAAQHKLVPLMCPAGRVVAVGDRYQAINAFRGADMDSVPSLSARLEADGRGLYTAPLTLTFRCPRSHVALANGFVSDLEAHPSNPEGVVVEECPLDDMLSAALPGDLVICPTNGPVISAALKLIGQGRPAYVRGRAVGDQLVNVLRGCGNCRTVSELAKKVDEWRSRELNRLALLDGVEDLIESATDRALGIQAILSACQSPAEAEPMIGRLFGDDRRAGVVTFSTIHRAKGDEAERVWLIEPPSPRMPTREWQVRQNRNLQYVALTRSKSLLTFVQPE